MDCVTGLILAANQAAEAPMAGASWAILAAVLSCSIIILGASLGIAFIGCRAVESIARQPEAGGRVFSAMIIAAALVEGVTFFALAICFLAVFWLR
jgi:F-type H+-transporting ATPase subunit c